MSFVEPVCKVKEVFVFEFCFLYCSKIHRRTGQPTHAVDRDSPRDPEEEEGWVRESRGPGVKTVRGTGSRKFVGP